MKKILVIAPHPDDEILGCGGLLSLLKKKKKYWLIITKMDEKYGYTNLQIKKRDKEIKKISSYLNFIKVFNLGFTTKNLNKDQLSLLIDKMSNVIKLIRPDTIFAPYLHDSHSDHFYTTYALNHILKSFIKVMIIITLRTFLKNFAIVWTSTELHLQMHLLCCL